MNMMYDVLIVDIIVYDMQVWCSCVLFDVLEWYMLVFVFYMLQFQPVGSVEFVAFRFTVSHNTTLNKRKYWLFTN